MTSQNQLKSIITRIKRIREERKQLDDDIASILKDAKDDGFDKAAIKRVVTYLEKKEKDPSALEEADGLFATYLHAVETSEEFSGAYNERARVCEAIQ